MTRFESLGPEEGVRASAKYEEWFSELSPLKQATYILMEKICALNMGVTEALIGLDSPDTLRIVAEGFEHGCHGSVNWIRFPRYPTYSRRRFEVSY
jgi:hypothetical protein